MASGSNIAVLLMILVPGNADPLSRTLLDRIEVLERKDLEQTVRIEHLEKQILDSIGKLNHLSTSNDDLQKYLDNQAKKLKDQEEIMMTLRQDVEYHKTVANISKRNFNILKSKVQKMGERTELLAKVNAKREEKHPEKLEEITEMERKSDGQKDEVKTQNISDQEVSFKLSSGVTLNTVDEDKEHDKNDMKSDEADPAETSSLDTEPETSSLDTEPETSSLDTEPETSSLDIEPETSSLDTEPKTNSLDTEPGTSSLDTEPETSSLDTEPERETGIPNTAVRDSLSLNTRWIRMKQQQAVRSITYPVAFQAVHSQATLQSPQIHDAVKFENVLLNQGNGYHDHHGLFIAPLPGFYLFSTSIMSDQIIGHNSVAVSIVKNGATLGTAISTGYTEKNKSEQSSVTVVTQLNIGDEVWINFIGPDGGRIWGNGCTSFAGILIM